MIADEQSKPALWRRVIWWIWCAITRPIRPMIFVALLGGGLIILWHAADRYYQDTGWSPATATLDGRIDQAFRAALPATGSVRVWQQELATALDPVEVGRPDILMARALAQSLETVTGRQELGLYEYAKRRSLSEVEGELRARPLWIRERVLDEAINERLADAEFRQLDPSGMIFADAATRERFTRASRLFDRAVEGAEGWFIDPSNQTLGLHALPGWHNRLDNDVWLGRDIDTLVNHACGLTFQGLGEHIEGCFDATVEPVDDPDLVLWQWTLLAYGLDSGQMDAPDGIGAGARLLAALRFAGLMAPDLELPPDRAVIDRALVTGAPLLTDAGEALAQPNRYVEEGADLARAAFEGRHARRIIALASDAAGLRRNVGAINALKLLSYARDEGDVRRLVAITDLRGEEALALFHLHRDNPERVFTLTDPFPPVSDEIRRQIFLGIGALSLAMLMLMLSYIWAWREAGMPRKSIIKRISRGAESLILGRKL